MGRRAFLVMAVSGLSLAACSKALDQRLPGLWTVQNPDRGEDLPGPDDRMLVAGGYAFMPGGGLQVSLQYRDRESKTHAESWDGSWRLLDPRRVEVNLLGSHKEVYEEAADDRLVRSSTTIGRRVWEQNVVLLKQR